MDTKSGSEPNCKWKIKMEDKKSGKGPNWRAFYLYRMLWFYTQITVLNVFLIVVGTASWFIKFDWLAILSSWLFLFYFALSDSLWDYDIVGDGFFLKGGGGLEGALSGEDDRADGPFWILGRED